MHTHLRAGAPLTGVPALSFYSLSNDFRQSITKTKRLFKYFKITEKAPKNHYIISYKTSINNGKNTDKKSGLQPTENQTVIK